MKINNLLLGLAVFTSLFIARTSYAICPVCVVAVGAGLGLSRWLGVDDVISSIWIGGLLWAVSVWTIEWMQLKKWRFKYDSLTITAAYYLLILAPLYFSGIIGHPMNTILGIDKIIFGSIVGTLVFVGGTLLHNYLKIKNGGKSYFSYQKVVVPFISLFVISLIFYFLLPWI